MQLSHTVIQCLPLSIHLDIKKVCDGSNCVIWCVDLQKGVELVVAVAQWGINSFIAVTPVQ